MGVSIMVLWKVFKYGDDRGGHPQTNEYGLISNVTHWMPLPEPPQESQSE